MIYCGIQDLTLFIQDKFPFYYDTYYDSIHRADVPDNVLNLKSNNGVRYERYLAEKSSSSGPSEYGEKYWFVKPEDANEYLESVQEDDMIARKIKEYLFGNKNTIKSSYSDFDFKSISNDVKSISIDELSEIDSIDSLIYYFTDRLSDYNVSVVDADNDFGGYDIQQWNNNYVKYSYANEYGDITVVCDLNSLLEDISEGYEDDFRNFLDALSTSIIHELTHVKQFESHSQRGAYYDEGKSQSDYLSDRDEISARVFGGLTELININYTKEQILEKLKTKEGIKDLFMETNQLYPYWEYFGEYSDEDKFSAKVWNQVLKEFYNALSNIE